MRSASCELDQTGINRRFGDSLSESQTRLSSNIKQASLRKWAEARYKTCVANLYLTRYQLYNTKCLFLLHLHFLFCNKRDKLSNWDFCSGPVWHSACVKINTFCVCELSLDTNETEFVKLMTSPRSGVCCLFVLPTANHPQFFSRSD